MNTLSNKNKYLYQVLIAALFSVLAMFGRTASDVILILDVTGSTGALLPNWQTKIITDFIAPLSLGSSGTRFALVSHRDFPYSPYGGSSDYGYRVEAPLDADTTDLITALDALSSSGGGDAPESQLEALRQAISGSGLDLNGDGDYLDKGDIKPKLLGINPSTPQVLIFHFTYPLSFHNYPAIEVNYPYSGVVNHPADVDAVKSAIDAICPVTTVDVYDAGGFKRVQAGCMLYTLIPSALKMLNSDGTLYKSESLIDQQTGKLLNLKPYALATNPAEELAEYTGGAVLSVGSSLEGLAEVVESVVEDTRICSEGRVPVELPTGIYCIEALLH
ncbi:hypothetical protein [Gynuella sp.]|uniref:hypothetical protein n=1 Tax=Gynuella sp. TaxID=2969146 RepID=UPI003D0C2923